MSLDRGRGRMRVAITFRYQAEHESGNNEYGYSFLCGREAESLPQFFEFETPALFNHEYFCGVFASTRALPRRCLARRRVISVAVLAFAAAEPERNGSVS